MNSPLWQSLLALCCVSLVLSCHVTCFAGSVAEHGRAAGRHKGDLAAAAATQQGAAGKWKHQRRALATGQQIFYNGGPMMVGAINIYLIYYGNWSNTPSHVIENFILSLSSSNGTPSGQGINRVWDWWRIVTKYKDQYGRAPGKVRLRGRKFDTYSVGKDLTGRIPSVISRHLQSRALPADNSGVYMILPSADVTETPADGYCAGTWPPTPGLPLGYCGWHSSYHSSAFGFTAKYTFVGNANRCPKRCGFKLAFPSTPNGNVGIDGMVNILAHELAEAVTDPTQNGWMSPYGWENGDLCNRQFPNATVGPTMAYEYNLVGQGGMRFLVQSMFDPVRNKCHMQA